MRRSYKFLLRPTCRQAGALAAMLKDHCTLYNAALQERRDAYRHASGTRIRYGDQSAQLTDIRAFDPDQGRWSFSSQQATLRRLNRAFEAFFRRVKTGEKPGYPRFRSVARFDTVEFPKDSDGCRWKQHRQAIQRLARLHAKVRRRRLDFAHTAANFLIRDADVIAHERLNIAGMTRRPKPRPAQGGGYEPNGAAAKAGLNKSILDAGWGVFLGILAHKAECAGRELIPVDPRNTSRTCPACGHVARENRNREVFECTACGHGDHADRIAALNIATRAGLALCAAA